MRSSPRIGLLAAAVEEIGDVRIFLGLGHAQLRAAGVGDDFAEDVGKLCGGKIVCMQRVELVAVLRHADGGGEAAPCACAGSRRTPDRAARPGSRARGRRGS